MTRRHWYTPLISPVDLLTGSKVVRATPSRRTASNKTRHTPLMDHHKRHLVLPSLCRGVVVPHFTPTDCSMANAVSRAKTFRRVRFVGTNPRIPRTKCQSSAKRMCELRCILTILSKHEHRHTKPFKCNFPDCITKGTGFATVNDLDRHYRSSKHDLAPTKGSGKGYICAACHVAPESRPKWWPRRDNFKAHIVRRHKNVEITWLFKAYVIPFEGRDGKVIDGLSQIGARRPPTRVV